MRHLVAVAVVTAALLAGPAPAAVAGSDSHVDETGEIYIDPTYGPEI